MEVWEPTFQMFLHLLRHFHVLHVSLFPICGGTEMLIQKDQLDLLEQTKV